MHHKGNHHIERVWDWPDTAFSLYYAHLCKMLEKHCLLCMRDPCVYLISIFYMIRKSQPKWGVPNWLKTSFHAHEYHGIQSLFECSYPTRREEVLSVEAEWSRQIHAIFGPYWRGAVAMSLSCFQNCAVSPHIFLSARRIRYQWMWDVPCWSLSWIVNLLQYWWVLCLSLW